VSTTLRAMQCFVGVCAAGSISRAAATLHIAQPALSLVIRNLEQDLGVALLNRTARGITPTAAGSRFLDHAREILGRVDSARADVRGDALMPRGKVSLAMPTSMANLLVVPLLRHTLSTWPDVYIKIIEASTGYIPGFVSSGHADLGLSFSNEASLDLRFEHIMDEELVVVSPPRTARKVGPRSVSLAGLPTMQMESLKDLPLVLPAAPHTLRRMLDAYQQQAGVDFRVIAEANAVAQLIQLASAGLAHTILSYTSVRHDAEQGRIVLHRVKKPPMRRSVFMCRSDTLPLSLAALAVANTVTSILTADGAALGGL
jgi:LysR family nitrogen assimilation transcriptional regulator